jgi:3-hydroxybutyryl-CoA dehydratase
MKTGDAFTEEFEVTEKIYSVFRDAFNDHNPLHIDEAFARQKGFQSIVMHGNILGGFISYFIGECLPMKNVVLHTQEIKYLRPVYMND